MAKTKRLKLQESLVERGMILQDGGQLAPVHPSNARVTMRRRLIRLWLGPCKRGLTEPPPRADVGQCSLPVALRISVDPHGAGRADVPRGGRGSLGEDGGAVVHLADLQRPENRQIGCNPQNHLLCDSAMTSVCRSLSWPVTCRAFRTSGWA